MQRRDLLRGLVVTVPALGIAGCVSHNDSDDPDGSALPAEQSDSADDGDNGWDDAPDVADLSVTGDDRFDLAASIRNHGTFDRPPVLEVTLASTADQPVTIGPFAGADTPLASTVLDHTTDATGIRLHGAAVVAGDDDCWEPADPNDDDRFVDLEPDASTTGELAVIPDNPGETDSETADGDGCYRAGAYRGETTVDVYDGESDPGTDEPADTATFELRIELA